VALARSQSALLVLAKCLSLAVAVAVADNPMELAAEQVGFYIQQLPIFQQEL
jgi:hypothetical protein